MMCSNFELLCCNNVGRMFVMTDQIPIFNNGVTTSCVFWDFIIL